MLILTIIVIGMAAGWVAQLILGRVPDWGEALIAGLFGSFIGGLLVNLVTGGGLAIRPTGLIGSVVGAVIVLAIWGTIRAPVHDRASGLTRAWPGYRGKEGSRVLLKSADDRLLTPDASAKCPQRQRL